MLARKKLQCTSALMEDQVNYSFELISEKFILKTIKVKSTAVSRYAQWQIVKFSLANGKSKQSYDEKLLILGGTKPKLVGTKWNMCDLLTSGSGNMPSNWFYLHSNSRSRLNFGKDSSSGLVPHV